VPVNFLTQLLFSAEGFIHQSESRFPVDFLFCISAVARRGLWFSSRDSLLSDFPVSVAPFIVLVFLPVGFARSPVLLVFVCAPVLPKGLHSARAGSGLSVFFSALGPSSSGSWPLPPALILPPCLGLNSS
jgi:hypothetical protein